MKLIEPSFEIIAAFPYHDMLAIVESAARTCYKSEDKIKEGSAKQLIRSCIKRGHESVLEHCGISVRIICDRGVSHELVRHRLASYSQESQRYCAYRSSVEFIFPWWYSHAREGVKEVVWHSAVKESESYYQNLLDHKLLPQDARSVLPSATKTEIVMTCNLREWRLVFKLRCAKAAHPEMRRIMIPMMAEFTKRWPVFFGDLVQSREIPLMEQLECGPWPSFCADIAAKEEAL